MAASSKGSDRPIRRPSRAVLSDETHDAIMALILNHEILPGEHINIDAIARDLDVSQTPVREALARLESENLVVKQPLRGYTATPLLTPAQVDDLFQFRALIEPWAASRAAMLHTPDDAAALRAELERARGVDPADFDAAHSQISAHDSRFHELIARMSGSDFVRDAFTRTHFHLHMFRLFEARKTLSAEQLEDPALAGSLFRGYYLPETGFRTVHGHTGIAEAILARDPETAHALMLEHVEGSRESNTHAASLLANA